MQSRDNIRFTCWLDVSLNALPKLLFDWSERACGKIPTVLRLSEVNKDRSKMQQTAHCYYGETTARVDSPHLPHNPKFVRSKSAQFFFSWVCLRSDRVLTTNKPFQGSFESVPRPPLQGGLGTFVWSAFGAHPSAIAAFSPVQTNRTKRENKLVQFSRIK